MADHDTTDGVTSLDPRLTFHGFVVDSTNRLASRAALSLAEPGAPAFSPLYLNGPTGQGKTHLLHAIGNAFLESHPRRTAIYMTAERFGLDFGRAARAGDLLTFKTRLRAADMLMVDDLQFLGRAKDVRDEFQHVVDEFTAGGRRLVVAADRSPQALEDVESRLAGRLGAGLVVDMRPADLPLRRAIAARKLEDMGVHVPDSVVDLLAARIPSNVRDLESALNRLVAYGRLSGMPVTMEFAVETLGEILKGTRRRVTIDEIQRAVAAHFDVEQTDLTSPQRAIAIARPRQIAMYLAKRLTTRSLPEIGRRFGNRDHSTVIHAVRRIEDLRAEDDDIDGAVRALTQTLGG